MNKNDCFLLGFITKLHGHKGSLVFYLDVDNPSEYKEMESVFINIDNKLIPFFISKIELKPSSNNAVVSIRDINSIESAQKLLKKELYLPLSCLPKLSDKNFYFHEIIDFEVIDKQLGNIGIIEKVIDLPNNPILSIKNSANQEILIPINDEFIEEVNRKEKKIIVDTPEGLIDLYTEA